jgi:hypothetical protein
MPWIHYPKSGMKLYGYVGDGILTGLIFLSILLLSFFSQKFYKTLTYSSLFFGSLIFVLGFYNLNEIRYEQANFTSDNIGITLASAGFHEGLGMYFNMFGGLGLLVGGLMMLIGKTKVPSNSQPSSRKKLLLYLPYGLGLLCIIGTLLYFLPQLFNFSSHKVPDNLKSIIDNDINIMVKALENNDFSTYSKLVHPVLAQSMGGEKMLRDFFEGTHKTFIEDKIKIKKITVDKIIDVKTRIQDKQALFVQKVTFSQNGIEFEESQKTLAINDNSSKQWKYITIGNNKSKAEIKKMFPYVNEELNLLEN